MSEELIKVLRERSRTIAPEYPGIHTDLDPWEHLWAITASYEGTLAANNDLHAFIAFLVAKLNLTPTEALELYRLEHPNKP